MQLDGKVAVVTGAARGLGRAYVEALAAEGTSEFMGEKHDRAVEIIASGQNIMVDGGTVCL